MVGWDEGSGMQGIRHCGFVSVFFLPAVKKVVVLWVVFRGALLGSTYHGTRGGGEYRRSIYLVCGVCGGVGGGGNFSLTGEEGAEELTRGPMVLLVYYFFEAEFGVCVWDFDSVEWGYACFSMWNC
jgi:hypothetical protein